MFGSLWLAIFFAATMYCFVLACIFLFVWYFHRENKVRQTIYLLTSGVEEISAEDFMRMREIRDGRRKVSNQWEFTGIYIIHNVTADIYYVGQSKNVLKRVSAHFSGSGNGDVYADMRYGCSFAVRAIPLEGSGYATLDALERDAIEAYDAYRNGYNKTAGNGKKGFW